MDRSAMINQLVEARYAAKVASGYKISNPAAIRARIATDLADVPDRALASELGVGPKPNNGRDYGITPLDRAIASASADIAKHGIAQASLLCTDEYGEEIAGQAIALAIESAYRRGVVPAA